MKRLLPVFALALWLVGCTGIPVSSDWDPDYNYSAVSTYAWLPAEQAGDGTAAFINNDLMDQRIRAAIDANLLAKGFQRVDDPTRADVLINYYMNVKDKIDIESFRSHFGYYPCFYCHGYSHSFYHGGLFHDDVWVREYQEGTLVIDMLEPKERRLVWRGVAERNLPRLENPEERRLYTVETVDAILERFPPR